MTPFSCLPFSSQHVTGVLLSNSYCLISCHISILLAEILALGAQPLPIPIPPKLLPQFITFCCQLGTLHYSGSPMDFNLCLFTTFLAKSSAFLGLELSTLNRGFKTPLPTIFTSSRLSVVLSAVRALPQQPVYLSPMNWCSWLGSLWIFFS